MKTAKTFQIIHIYWPYGKIPFAKTRKRFKNDNERTKFLHKYLSRVKAPIQNHYYTDCVVEISERFYVNSKTPVENWHIGT